MRSATIDGVPTPVVRTRPRCYVASPLGFTEAGRHYYEHVYLPALTRVVEPIDPWAIAARVMRTAADLERSDREVALAIAAANMAAIRDATLLAAYLEGPEPDSGTVAEVG
jgi:nucleoside 2-deoxyribosyltransferase